MNEEILEIIRSLIDAKLETSDPNIGIAFGFKLYEAFGQQGWFTTETFTVAGTNAFPLDVVAYKKSHPVSAWWDMDEWEYRIGTPY